VVRSGQIGSNLASTQEDLIENSHPSRHLSLALLLELEAYIQAV